MNNYGLPTEGIFLLIFFLLAVFVAIVVGIVTYRKEKHNNKIEKCEVSKEEKLTLDAKTLAVLTYLEKLENIPEDPWPHRESQQKLDLLDKKTTVSFLDYIKERADGTLLPDISFKLCISNKISISLADLPEDSVDRNCIGSVLFRTIFGERFSSGKHDVLKCLKALLSECNTINEKIENERKKVKYSAGPEREGAAPISGKTHHWRGSDSWTTVSHQTSDDWSFENTTKPWRIELNRIGNFTEYLKKLLITIKMFEIPSEYQEFFSKYFPKADNYNIIECRKILIRMQVITDKARIELEQKRLASEQSYAQVSSEDQSLLNIKNISKDLSKELGNILNKKSALICCEKLVS